MDPVRFAAAVSNPERPPGRPLGKRHVERLLATYDHDAERALTEALRAVLGRPDLNFDQLVALTAMPAERSDALRARRVDAFDDLARELNERRRL